MPTLLMTMLMLTMTLTVGMMDNASDHDENTCNHHDNDDGGDDNDDDDADAIDYEDGYCSNLKANSKTMKLCTTQLRHY